MTIVRSMLRSASCGAVRGALVLTALLSAAATSGRAQASGQSGPAFAPAGPSRIISTNPFLPLFGYFSAEYEQRVKDNVAFAVSGSSVEYDERITHVDAKVRLYPNDRALEGFSMATSLGVAWIRRNNESCDFFGDCIIIDVLQQGQQLRKRTFSTPTFAIEGAYQWLLGRSRSTAIIAGFGAKRYLGGSSADFQGLSRVLPTGRLSIGYGF